MVSDSRRPGPGWVTISPSSGVTPGVLYVYANATWSAFGTYSWSLTISSPGVRSVKVNVALNALGPGLAVLSAASGDKRLARGMIASVYGLSIAKSYATGSPPLPTVLAGSSVALLDSSGATRLAPLFFVSPNQINILIPEDVAIGPGMATVNSATGPVAVSQVQIDAVAPGLFLEGIDATAPVAALAARYFSDGTSVPVEVFHCDTTACTTTPIDLTVPGDVYLSLYATGVRHASALSDVSCKIGSTTVPVQYAGAQGDFPGLDQVNIQLPASLAGTGEQGVILTVGGISSKAGQINFK